MTECYVNLTYRGLPLGSRVRLTEAERKAGFLELAAPMPVGTLVTIATEEGVSFDVKVIEVREQATSGMVVQPVVSPAAEAWWGAHVGSIAAAVPVEVVQPKRRHDVEDQLVDDGRKTTVMAVAEPSLGDSEPVTKSELGSRGSHGRRRKSKRR